MKKFLTVLLVIAVMFTFSFSSAFAAQPYAEKTSIDKPVAQSTDFIGTSAKFGVSTVQVASEVKGLEVIYDEYLDGAFAAPAQKVVDEAYAKAIAAMKEAKTGKELLKARDDFEDVVGENGNYTYRALYQKYRAAAHDIVIVPKAVEDVVDPEYFAVPDYAINWRGDFADDSIPGTFHSQYFNNDLDITAAHPTVFKYIVDAGYYGYVGNDTDKWAETVDTKAVKREVEDWLEDYAIGEVSVEDVYAAGSSLLSEMTKYGRKVYAEYAAVIDAWEDFDNLTKITVEDWVKVCDVTNEFAEKYNFYSFMPNDSYDEELLVACDKWYIANLEENVEAIADLKTDADYTKAKKDIIETAKTLFDLYEKYSGYKYGNLFKYMTDNYYAVETVFGALVKIMGDDTEALEEVCDGDLSLDQDLDDDIYTALVESSVAGKYDFDASADNLAAIEAARAAFDAYVADYSFAYEGKEDVFASFSSRCTIDVATVGELKNYEAKLLAAEYNKVNVALEAAKDTEEENAEALANLNNAKVTVTTQALGKGKIRVQATIDNNTWNKINGYTVEYKFFKKKASANAYKGYSDRAVNYTTFKLTKGTKYNFKCQVTLKDSKGNVVATRSYLGSTTGIRTAK